MSQENKYLEMWAKRLSSSNKDKFQVSYCNFSWISMTIVNDVLTMVKIIYDIPLLTILHSITAFEKHGPPWSNHTKWSVQDWPWSTMNWSWSTMVWPSSCCKGPADNHFWLSMVRLMASFRGQFTGFSLGHLHTGGRQVHGDKALMGDINLMGGPNFDRLYHKLKVVIVKLQLHDAIYQLRFY